jgi:hypothetical protein
MASDALIHSRHAWSLMNEKDLAHKLHKLGLIVNRPEPALICRECRYALQPSGIRVSKHLAENHAVPASNRKELVSYVYSLDLPNPNLLSGRRNGSEPHPHLLFSRGAACRYCTFHSKSCRLVQQHITHNHWEPNHSPHWVRDGVRLNVSMQSWTQNGNRTYWVVDIRPEGFAYVSDGMTNHLLRRMRWLEILHKEERKRVKQDNKRYDVMDTGTYDEVFVGNWMHCTDWTIIFSGVNRELLVAELELSTGCSSMSSASSWSPESAILSTSVGDSELMQHQKTRIGPTSPCREFKETARTVNELVEDDEFVDLGLDDWPVCEASDGSLECLSPCAIKIVNDGKGKKILSSRDENLDNTVQEKMANIVENLSYSLCCEEFVDGQSSTTMLVYFCAVLGISNDGSTFDRPRNYTPKLSALIHSARLVCLEAIHPWHRHSHVG